MLPKRQECVTHWQENHKSTRDQENPEPRAIREQPLKGKGLRRARGACGASGKYCESISSDSVKCYIPNPAHNGIPGRLRCALKVKPLTQQLWGGSTGMLPVKMQELSEPWMISELVMGDRASQCQAPNLPALREGGVSVGVWTPSPSQTLSEVWKCQKGKKFVLHQL